MSDFPYYSAITASEYLAQVVTLRDLYGMPSITLLSLEAFTGPPGEEREAVSWKPGVASYSWGIQGDTVTDTAGQIGIRIKVWTWRSNQISNRIDPHYQTPFHGPYTEPYNWHQFAGPATTTVLTFTPAGSDVHLLNGDPADPNWEGDSFLFDPPAQQLLFHVPGMGAPLGIMIATFHPTGYLSFG